MGEEDVNVSAKHSVKDLIQQVKAMKPELNNDDDVVQYALSNTISGLEQGMTSKDFEQMMARMEQLETRLLEQELVNKMILKRLGKES